VGDRTPGPRWEWQQVALSPASRPIRVAEHLPACRMIPVTAWARVDRGHFRQRGRVADRRGTIRTRRRSFDADDTPITQHGATGRTRHPAPAMQRYGSTATEAKHDTHNQGHESEDVEIHLYRVHIGESRQHHPTTHPGPSEQTANRTHDPSTPRPRSYPHRHVLRNVSPRTSDSSRSLNLPSGCLQGEPDAMTRR
jgi:hypothetical protein